MYIPGLGDVKCWVEGVDFYKMFGRVGVHTFCNVNCGCGIFRMRGGGGAYQHFLMDDMNCGNV